MDFDKTQELKDAQVIETCRSCGSKHPVSFRAT
jgi:hypothetical protein